MAKQANIAYFVYAIFFHTNSPLF